VEFSAHLAICPKKLQNKPAVKTSIIIRTFIVLPPYFLYAYASRHPCTDYLFFVGNSTAARDIAAAPAAKQNLPEAQAMGNINKLPRAIYYMSFINNIRRA
jgi:hypothetical protein